MFSCMQSDLEAASEVKNAAEASAAALEAARNILQQVWHCTAALFAAILHGQGDCM